MSSFVGQDPVFTATPSMWRIVFIWEGFIASLLPTINIDHATKYREQVEILSTPLSYCQVTLLNDFRQWKKHIHCTANSAGQVKPYSEWYWVWDTGQCLGPCGQHLNSNVSVRCGHILNTSRGVIELVHLCPCVCSLPLWFLKPNLSLAPAPLALLLLYPLRILHSLGQVGQGR